MTEIVISLVCPYSSSVTGDMEFALYECVVCPVLEMDNLPLVWDVAGIMSSILRSLEVEKRGMGCA